MRQQEARGWRQRLGTPFATALNLENHNVVVNLEAFFCGRNQIPCPAAMSDLSAF